MGLKRWLGLGRAVTETAEVFVENRTKSMEASHAERLATLEQMAAEFARPRGGWFDQLVDGLNRLPRPALAAGTLALFVFAMTDPVAFAVRMQGLSLVPDPLWWLLGAIVSFYFGARELHYFRDTHARITPERVAEVTAAIQTLEEDKAVTDVVEATRLLSDNAAVAAWQRSLGQ